MKIVALLFCIATLCASDYDCVVVSTSPIPLFEALYQASLGKKVLVLDESDRCGGVWSTISICGQAGVDIGCHTIGNNPQIADFLTRYAGCELVSYENPCERYSQMTRFGYYFSGGCQELIERLLERIRLSSIELRLSERLETANLENDHLLLTTSRSVFTADKLFAAQASHFTLGGDFSARSSETPHLYLLVADPEPPRFSFLLPAPTPLVKRASNLTYFAHLMHTGQQLIVCQTFTAAADPAEIFEALKNKGLFSATAFLLRAEPYTYTQHFSHWFSNLPPEYAPYVESVHTNNFSAMAQYIEKWKTALAPYDALR